MSSGGGGAGRGAGPGRSQGTGSSNPHVPATNPEPTPELLSEYNATIDRILDLGPEVSHSEKRTVTDVFMQKYMRDPAFRHRALLRRNMFRQQGLVGRSLQLESISKIAHDRISGSRPPEGYDAALREEYALGNQVFAELGPDTTSETFMNRLHQLQSATPARVARAAQISFRYAGHPHPTPGGGAGAGGGRGGEGRNTQVGEGPAQREGRGTGRQGGHGQISGQQNSQGPSAWVLSRPARAPAASRESSPPGLSSSGSQRPHNRAKDSSRASQSMSDKKGAK